MNRQFFAQGMIILAVTVGSWMMLVEPMVVEIQRLEEEIADAEGATANLQTTHGAAISRLPDIRRKVRDVRRRNRLVADTTTLSAAMFGLADEHGVDIRMLDPGSWGSGGRKRTVNVNEVKMSVEGEYERVARFISAACEMGGFIRPKSLELTPRQGEGAGTVLATCTLETMQFRIREQLAVLESTDDQP